MRYVAWEADLDKPDKSGFPRRVSLERAARRANPNPDAVRALQEPCFPSEVSYLESWARDLRMGAGEGLNGVAALSWSTLDAWARRMDIVIAPHEARALFLLDGAYRHPETVKAD